jgi:putative transposase
MSRPLRVQFEGAVYHVTSRGNERTSIFRDDRDRTRFLEMVASVSASSGWRIHGYCLMGNHYHLIVETARANLARGMQRVNGRYTQWFNVRHRRVGHLLQGRYKAVLVARDSHLLELCRYVVLNPVRAGVCASADRWRWSNYRATAGLSPGPRWLAIDWTLSQFSSSKRMARELYRRFVAEGKGQATEPAVRHQIFFGGDDFLREVATRLKETPRRSRLSSVAFESVRRAVAREFGIPPESLSRRRGGEDKMAAIYLASKLCGHPGTEVAAEFGVKGARVSNVVTEIETGRRPALARRIRRIEGRLTS